MNRFSLIFAFSLVFVAALLSPATALAACSEIDITRNDSKSGELTSGDCTVNSLIGGSDLSQVDVYKLVLTSSISLTVEMKSAAVDSFLRIYNEDYSQEKAEDDDSGDGRDAKIDAVALDAGTYHILANSSLQVSDLGTYTLTTSSSGGQPGPQTLIASSVLPTSRSVKVGKPATAFATIGNASSTVTALQCSLSLGSNINAGFSYQITDPATNKSIGSANTPVDIGPSKFQSFIFSITPNSAFAPQEIEIKYSCQNSPDAAKTIGLNTLLLSASTGEAADIIALVATPVDPGIVNLPDTTGTGLTVFSVATVNVGDSDDITVTVDTGLASYDHFILMCQTNPATAACINPSVASSSPIELTINSGETPTFAIFISGKENVAFDPAINRLFVRFKDQSGATRGATSVAVRTKP